MENDPQFSFNPHPENNEPNFEQLSSIAPSIYPPKPELENKKGNVWVRSITSLALYLLIGYYFFSANWTLLLILTGIVIFHELGHFLAMKLFHYKELGIFFIPLLGAYASGTKREISQRQSAIILLAGPLPGIIVGVILFFLSKSQFADLHYRPDILGSTASLLIFLNVLNLLPVYPLDGGQLLNRLFLDDSHIVGKTFVILSALALGFFAIKLGAENSYLYVLLVFPLSMLFRLQADTKLDAMTRKVEKDGINLEKTYDELSDEDYWKIRNILIQNNYSSLRNIHPAPPYEYSSNEDRVVTVIENLLQRTIIQDLSWWGKIIIILIWMGSFAAPFLLSLDLPFAHYQAR
ncbi:MAG TPA: site-2 protease family protein [Chitinophagaceae bacterium]|jgi:Zn-dependent protease